MSSLKTLLLLLVVAFCLATSFAAEDSNAGEWTNAAATKDARANPTFALLWGKEKDTGRYYLNDRIIVVVGYDKDPSAQSCSPTLTLKFKQETRNKFSEQTRDADKLTTAEFEQIAPSYKFNEPVQAYAYRVVAGDNAESIDTVTVNGNGCDWLLTAGTDSANKETKDVSVENTGVKIDTTPARLIQITTRKEAGSYSVGTQIDIELLFSKAVILENHQARLILNTDAVANFVGYGKNAYSRTDFNTLVFKYVVGHNEATTALDVQDIELNGVQIITSSSLLPVMFVAPTGAGVEKALVPKSPSIASLTNSKIVITKSTNGFKFPPFKYDKKVFPNEPVTANALDVHIASPPAVPVRVYLTPIINKITHVNERTQTYNADIDLKIEWFDSRFANKLCGAATCTDAYTVELPYERIHEIWHPEIVAHNARHNTTHRMSDQKLYISSTGLVTVRQRVVGEFYRKNLNVRAFPYEGALLTFEFRSAVYDSLRVNLLTRSADNAESTIRGMKDGVYHFIKYNVAVAENTDGNSLSHGYAIHTTTVTAKRRAVQTNLLIVWPIVFILGVVFVAYLLPTQAESRLILTGLSMVGTLLINYSVQAHLPQVSYVSRIGILIMFNYIHILYTFLWFTFLRKLQQGVDEVLELARHKALTQALVLPVAHHDAGASTDASKPPTTDDGLTTKVMFCMPVSFSTATTTQEHIDLATEVSRYIYFIFCVISTAVILAAKIN